MYIIKNALRCIGRAKGRNILIGIITLVIAISACIGLSIRQASENAKSSTLEGMSVTATISYDRSSMMSGMGGGGGKGGFDRDQFAGMMGSASSLTLSQYQTYAAAPSVQDFYYTLTAYLDGSESFLPVSNESEDDSTITDSLESADSDTSSQFPGGMGGFGGMMGGGRFSSGEFTLTGYSSDTAMTEFVNGIASIAEGSVFEEGTTEATCIISQELALYNDLSVGDTIVLTNPSVDTETYTLTVCGIYTSTATNDFSMSMFGGGQDPANQIYMSAPALQLILDASDSVSTTITDEDTGREQDSAVTGNLSATYVLPDTDAYYAFEQEVRDLGLDTAYAVSSNDITAFENSLTPLKTLSKMAGWFLLVILIIGGVILVVLNIFNIRERKYEVGVLTAMGMKKWKVATQFLCEILVVTMLAVVLGAAIGAVCSVPVTNALLAGQIESQQSQQTQMDNNFGRPGNMSMPGGMPSDLPSDIPDMFGGSDNPFTQMFGGAADYISEVDSAMDLTVVVQMIGVGLLLTLVAGAVSVLFIMRYDPLKILANRD